MGQRHQFFIKVLNPVKTCLARIKPKDLTKARKMFGNGKYTVLAFHHQWLYGRAAVANILNVLHFTNQDAISTYGSPFGEDFSTFSDNPLQNYIDAVTQIISTQACSLHPRGLGIESVYFLNADEDDMRNDFTQGDNNDGITIIDSIERKYCLMNIYNYELEEDENHGIYTLPALEPVSARAYMKAYYGETVETHNPYWLENKTDIEAIGIINEAKMGNIELQLALNEVSNGVLTLQELKKMFPKYYKKTVK
jgi:hypothetical protein